MGEVVRFPAPPVRPRSCFVCAWSRLGEQTWCPVYGFAVDDESGAASDCPVYQDDPART